MAATEVTGSLRLLGSSDLRFGGHADFDVATVGRLARRSEVLVYVVARQGGVVVFQQAARAPYSFALADQSSDNLEWPGGPAEVQATLVYRPDGTRTADKVVLDSVTFTVEG